MGKERGKGLGKGMDGKDCVGLVEFGRHWEEGGEEVCRGFAMLIR